MLGVHSQPKMPKVPLPSLGLNISRGGVFNKRKGSLFLILSFSGQDLFNEALGNHVVNVSLHSAHECRMILTDR